MNARPVLLGLLVLIPSPISSQTLEVEAVTMTFGVLDGPDDQVIGRVEDIAVGPDGDMFLTDALQMRVGWVRPDGTLVGWFGREGDGPKEFSWGLGSVVVAPDGRVVVADAGHRRLVYLTTDGGELRFEDVVRVPMIVSDLCYLGERMFVMSHHEGKVLHEVDENGAVVASFGAPLDTPFKVGPRWQRMIDSYSADGELLCVGEDLLVVLPHILPEVRAFRPDGSIAWTHELMPYSRTTPTETDRGTVQMLSDPETGRVNESESLWIAGEGLLGAQLVDVRFPERPEDALTELRFLSLSSGELVSTQNGVPRIAVLWNGEFVGWETSPFPRLVRFRGEVR